MSREITELDRPVPLYMQVVRQLRAQIAAGDLRDGDRLPSQREMMARWHISMQTASKVIGAMKTEGLAVPSVGRDTVIAPGAAARIATAAQGTAYSPAGATPGPATTVTSAAAGKAAAPGPVAEILGIPSERRALRRTETRGDDGQAASITVSWYPPAIADKAPRLADSKPLAASTRAYIAEATGTRVRRADEEYQAAPADDNAAAALGIPSGSPVLVIRTRHYAADGTLIEYAETTAPAGRPYSRTYTITGN
jgi:DNA-binding GntR family transcriptional regulator